MSLEIRKASLLDLDAVESLYNDVCDFLATKDYNPGFKKGDYPTRREAVYFLTSEALYVAKQDGKVIGSFALTHNKNSETNPSLKQDEAAYQDLLFLHIFVVHPRYQRQGLGSKLLSFVMQRAGLEGVKAVRLYVAAKNYAAKNAYEKNGFVCSGREDLGLGQYGLPWFEIYEKTVPAAG